MSRLESSQTTIVTVSAVVVVDRDPKDGEDAPQKSK